MTDYNEKRKPKNDEFFLDADHKKFKPGVTHLRFEAVYTPYITFETYFFIAFFLFLFTLTCAAIVYVWYREETSYAEYGVETTALIYDCRVTSGEGGRSHTFNYQFHIDTIIYYDEDSFYRNKGDCADIRPNVQIEYVEDNPEMSRIIDPQLHLSNSYIIGVIFVLFLAGLTALSSRGFFYWLSSQRRYERLLKSNILLEGTILETKEHRDHYLFHYETISPAGALLRRWQNRHFREYKGGRRPSPGTPVTILYADDNCHVML